MVKQVGFFANFYRGLSYGKKKDYNFSVCKVKDYSEINFDNEVCFLGRTDEEYSLVCIMENVPNNIIERDGNWKAFRIQ